MEMEKIMEEQVEKNIDDMSMEDVRKGFEKIIKDCEKAQDEIKKRKEEINEMKRKHDETVKKFGGEENYANAVNDFFGKLANGEIKIKVVSDKEMEEIKKGEK